LGINHQRARLVCQIDQVEQLRGAEIPQVPLQCHSHLRCDQQNRRSERQCSPHAQAKMQVNTPDFREGFASY
jgi:hypothetical protein